MVSVARGVGASRNEPRPSGTRSARPEVTYSGRARFRGHLDSGARARWIGSCWLVALHSRQESSVAISAVGAWNAYCQLGFARHADPARPKRQTASFVPKVSPPAVYSGYDNRSAALERNWHAMCSVDYGRPRPMCGNPDQPTDVKAEGESKVKRRYGTRLPLAIVLVLPFLMGGCPEFRDEAVSAVQTATQGIVVSALDLFFEQFREN